MRNESLDDDVQLAIALSLSEAQAKPPTQNGGTSNLPGLSSSSQTHHEDTTSDEALARALQDQFNCEQQQQAHSPFQPLAGGLAPPYRPPPLPAAPPSHPQPSSSIPTPLAPVFIDPKACAGCHKSLTSLGGMFSMGSSRYITALGRNWHPACFVCSSCRVPFSSGIHFNVGEDGQPYHPECYKQLFHPRCKVCSDFLPTQEGNKIHWSEIPFWKERHCPIHNNDGTKRCTACARMKPTDEQWADLDDGRALCLSCLTTMVVDTQACQPLYEDVLQFYASKGMPLPARPPLLLVETGALNSAENRETAGRGRGDGPVFHTRGLCLTEYSTIRKVVRRTGLFPFSVAEEEVHIGPTRCQVTAILVLYGLPHLLTGSILAHECMHAWLRLSGFPHLSPEVEEGLCQLMALLWLEAQQSKGFQDAWEERLAAFFGHQIRTDPSVVYGDGLRAAHEAFQKFGLKTTLDTVHRTERLPV